MSESDHPKPPSLPGYIVVGHNAKTGRGVMIQTLLDTDLPPLAHSDAKRIELIMDAAAIAQRLNTDGPLHKRAIARLNEMYEAIGMRHNAAQVNAYIRNTLMSE